MSDELKPTRDDINAMRLKAFSTNSHDDRMAYYKACSGWFQDEDYRVLARAERDDALICAALEYSASLSNGFSASAHIAQDMKDGIFPSRSDRVDALANAIRALQTNPDALAAIKAKAEVRG